jgi:hypothetical protein
LIGGENAADEEEKRKQFILIAISLEELTIGCCWNNYQTKQSTKLIEMGMEIGHTF